MIGLRSRRTRTSPKRPGAYLVAANDFGTYCVPRKALHRPACQTILAGAVYEPETIGFLVERARGDIVHAGAFFGDFLPALARAYERVWAFEPNPDSFKCAEITVRLNDLGNLTLRNSGLGAAAGSAKLVTERHGQYLGGGSFVVDEPGRTRIETIDEVVPSDRQVGMIHLDVEGYEAQALEGARETIQRCRPIIVLETLVPISGYAKSGTVGRNHILTPA